MPGVPQLDLAGVDEYRRGIEPLAQSGKLGALLAQFPPSFKQTSESQDYLDALLARFEDYPVAVELRHRSWSDDFAGTLYSSEELQVFGETADNARRLEEPVKGIYPKEFIDHYPEMAQAVSTEVAPQFVIE